MIKTRISKWFCILIFFPVLFSSCALNDEAKWKKDWEPLFRRASLLKGFKIEKPDGEDWKKESSDIAVRFKKMIYSVNDTVQAVVQIRDDVPNGIKTLTELKNYYQKQQYSSVIEAVYNEKIIGSTKVLEYEVLASTEKNHLLRIKGILYFHPKSSHDVIDIGYSRKSKNGIIELEYQKMGQKFINNFIINNQI